jgi:hypothetical protein
LPVREAIPFSVTKNLLGFPSVSQSRARDK